MITAVSHADQERIVRLIEADVAPSVPTDCRHLIVDVASRLREFCTRDSYEQRCVDDVQQRLHDEFIDTAWPRCPDHPNHPLVDGSWTCTESGRAIAPLGQLRQA